MNSRPAWTVAGDSEHLPRRSLHDQLVSRLRNLIIVGDLEPGMRIPERELCDRFGVSRTPLREAFKVLAWEGLVELQPNRGARVTDIRVADVDEVFPVMGALEALSGELACQHVTDAEIDAIRLTHEEMVKCYRRRDLRGYFHHNELIHTGILDAAHNTTLSRTYQGLSARVRRMRYVADLSEARWGAAVNEHEQMLSALQARDGDALALILKTHLKNKLDTVREYLIANR